MEALLDGRASFCMKKPLRSNLRSGDFLLVQDAEGAGKVHLNRDLVFGSQLGAAAAGANAALVAVHAQDSSIGLLKLEIVLLLGQLLLGVGGGIEGEAIAGDLEGGCIITNLEQRAAVVAAVSELQGRGGGRAAVKRVITSSRVNCVGCCWLYE